MWPEWYILKSPPVPIWRWLLLWSPSTIFNTPPSTVVFPLNVVTPDTLTLSKFVCPSTSKSALRSIAPLAVIAPVKVETPAIETLSKFVWPSTSKSFAAIKFPKDLTVPLERTWNLVPLLVISLIYTLPLLLLIK